MGLKLKGYKKGREVDRPRRFLEGQVYSTRHINPQYSRWINEILTVYVVVKTWTKRKHHVKVLQIRQIQYAEDSGRSNKTERQWHLQNMSEDTLSDQMKDSRYWDVVTLDKLQHLVLTGRTHVGFVLNFIQDNKFRKAVQSRLNRAYNTIETYETFEQDIESLLKDQTQSKL